MRDVEMHGNFAYLVGRDNVSTPASYLLQFHKL